MLERLRTAEGIDWTRVTAFHMDEYLGLSPDAPQRFAELAEGALFEHGCRWPRYTSSARR